MYSIFVCFKFMFLRGSVSANNKRDNFLMVALLMKIFKSQGIVYYLIPSVSGIACFSYFKFKDVENTCIGYHYVYPFSNTGNCVFKGQ